MNNVNHLTQQPGFMTREGGDESYYRVATLHKLATLCGISYVAARRAYAKGKIESNGEDVEGNPIFFIGRLPQLKAALE